MEKKNLAKQVKSEEIIQLIKLCKIHAVFMLSYDKYERRRVTSSNDHKRTQRL
jgi:hypothetical protein